MGDQSRKGMIGIFVLLLAFFIIFMAFCVYTMGQLGGDHSGGPKYSFMDSKESPIAIVEVEGAIFQSIDVIKKLHIAEKNDAIKAIIVRVNSPGGAVGPTQEIYEEIRRIDKIKPIYSSFGSIAASGGYYIGAATREIYSNAGTLTGSIGVIMQFMNLQKLYQFLKMDPQTIKSGKYKDVGNPFREMTGEEKVLMGNMISGVHEQFRKDILKTRKDKIKGDINAVTQGQIFSGQQAFDHGLVDKIGSMWSAARDIHKNLKLKEKFGVQFIKLKKRFTINDFLTDIEESISSAKHNPLFKLVPLFLYTD